MPDDLETIELAVAGSFCCPVCGQINYVSIAQSDNKHVLYLPDIVVCRRCNLKFIVDPSRFGT